MTDSPLARVLRAELERKGWSSAELARRADMPAPTVWRYLQGKQEPGFTAARALVRALGRSLAWLDKQLGDAASA